MRGCIWYDGGKRILIVIIFLIEVIVVWLVVFVYCFFYWD